MSNWWEDVETDAGKIEPDKLLKMRHAYFRSFYEHSENRQVYAHLRKIARNWPGSDEKCVAVDDLLNLVKVFCFVDELEAIKGEAKVAQSAALPEQVEKQGVPGYSPGTFDQSERTE